MTPRTPGDRAYLWLFIITLALTVAMVAGVLFREDNPPPTPVFSTSSVPSREDAQVKTLQDTWSFASPADKRVVCRGWREQPGQSVALFIKNNPEYLPRAVERFFTGVC